MSDTTTMTGVSPDRSSERGTLRQGSALPRRFSSWEITSGLSATTEVAQHVGRIVERMAGHADALRRTGERVDGFELSIVGRFEPALDDNPGVNLTGEQLEFLACVRASLDLGIVPEPSSDSDRARPSDRALAEDE